jgi:hypothetical protein
MAVADRLVSHRTPSVFRLLIPSDIFPMGSCIVIGVDAMTDMVLATPELIEETVVESYRRYGKEGGFVIT